MMESNKLDLFANIRILLSVRDMRVVDLVEKISLSRPGYYDAIKRNSIETRYLFEIADVLNVPISLLFTDLEQYISTAVKRNDFLPSDPQLVSPKS